MCLVEFEPETREKKCKPFTSGANVAEIFDFWRVSPRFVDGATAHDMIDPDAAGDANREGLSYASESDLSDFALGRIHMNATPSWQGNSPTYCSIGPSHDVSIWVAEYCSR